MPGQRKVIVFISAGVRVEPQVSVPYSAEGNSYAFRAEHCNARLQRAMTELFRRAGLANVTIQALDVRGLLAGDQAPTLAAIGAVSTSGGIDLRVEFLRGVAEQTGGRAVVRNNDLEREVRPLMEESGFYYLLGVEASVADDGRLHAIQVRADRPDVEVRTRRGYYAPTPDERKRIVGVGGGRRRGGHGWCAAERRLSARRERTARCGSEGIRRFHACGDHWCHAAERSTRSGASREIPHHGHRVQPGDGPERRFARTRAGFAVERHR